jgi:hypothetical protein
MPKPSIAEGKSTFIGPYFGMGARRGGTASFPPENAQIIHDLREALQPVRENSTGWIPVSIVEGSKQRAIRAIPFRRLSKSKY